MKKAAQIAILLAIPVLFYLFHLTGLNEQLTFSALKENQHSLAIAMERNFFYYAGLYFILYVFITALSIPGAAILTLAGGSLFGLLHGLIVVSFASTIGATIAFLTARFLFRDAIRSKFNRQWRKVDKGVSKEGAFYLFALRLVPVFPFFMINLVMGLTNMGVWRYFFVSQIGMLPGTIVYVNAGTQLANVDSLSDILSLPMLVSLALLGLLPIVSKKILELIKSRGAYRGFARPRNYDYNLVAIGAGSAGLVSSYIGAAVKAKVAIIEKHKMGGDCLNTGCVPSKALIRTASVIAQAARAEQLGLKKINVEFEFADVMERVQRVIKKIEPHDSVERYTGLGVDCLAGEAKIKSPWEVEVAGKTITTKNIVVATGAHPFVPDLPGIDKIDYLTSDTVWNLREQPKKMLVLGGGPIGSELTQTFHRLGCNVTLVEKGDRLLSREDRDVSDLVLKQFKSEGIDVRLDTTAVEFRLEGSRKVLLVEKSGASGAKDEIEFDQVLVALGRRANVTGFGLENLGVEIRENGTVAADDFLRTNIPNIFVCGDVTGPYQFTHTAAHQAWFCAVNALFGVFKKFPVDYSVIPWATYTEPEVARVGLNETEANEQGIDYEVSIYQLDDLDRAITDAEDHGFIKVLTPPGSDRILGVTMVGAHTGNLIAEFVTAMKYNLGLNKILGTIHIYPTMTEANKYAAGIWKKAHAPKKALDLLERFHAWRRG